MNPAMRLIQLAVTSLGYPCDADGWSGPKTTAAMGALLDQGPKAATAWAAETLARGLEGLGYLETAHDLNWNTLRPALYALWQAGGAPKASVIDPARALVGSTVMKDAGHSRVLRQGKAGHIIDTIMMHCGALPGDWHKSKSDLGMVKAIHQMHTDPVSRGGRGWSDTGYHGIITPSGKYFDARPINRIGAGAIGHNHGVFHLLMIEDTTIKKMGNPEDYFTPATIATAKRKIEEICQLTNIRHLRGHNEVAAKLCPGFIVKDEYWTDRNVT